MFEWDEDKRQATLRKHGIDFADAIEVVLNDPLVLPGRSEAETRLIAIGPLADKLIAVVFTMRGDAYRLITARRARNDEEARYKAIYARRGSSVEE